MFNNCISLQACQRFLVCVVLCNRCALCRYISSGNAIMDIAKDFRVGLETAREAIHLTLRVLWEELEPRYMKVCTGCWKGKSGSELRAHTVSSFATLKQSALIAVFTQIGLVSRPTPKIQKVKKKKKLTSNVNRM